MMKKYIIILMTLASGCGTHESAIPINSTGNELSSETKDATILRKANESGIDTLALHESHENEVMHTDANEAFDYQMKRFESISLPLTYDPHQEPDWKLEKPLNDSLFVISFVNPHQYDEDPGNRTYGYYDGKKIFENDTVVGVIYLFGFSAGHTYWLYTYSNHQLKDSLIISELASDFSEMYGTINEDMTIWRKINYLDYDATTDSIFVQRSEEDSFRIERDGEIRKMKSRD